MIGNKIGHRLDPYLHPVLKLFSGEHGNPNFFTFMGFVVTLVASFLVIKGFWFFAGLAIILSGLFDLFDGVVARKLGKVTALGSFLDSVLDRYSDLLFLLALLIYYLRKGDPDLVILTLWSASVRFDSLYSSQGGVVTRSVQHRAYGTGGTDHPSLYRDAISMDGSFLWILVILTHFTVLQRFYYVWKKLRVNDKR